MLKKDEFPSQLQQDYEDFHKLLKTGGQISQGEIETSQIDPEHIKEMLVNSSITSLHKLKQSQEEMNDTNSNRKWNHIYDNHELK